MTYFLCNSKPSRRIQVPDLVHETFGFSVFKKPYSHAGLKGLDEEMTGERKKARTSITPGLIELTRIPVRAN